MRDKLPRRQEETLNHIIAFVRERRYAPSVRELGDLMGLKSTATVHAHLRGLAARGLISLPPGQRRSIQLPPYEALSGDRDRTVFVPLVSRLPPDASPLDTHFCDATPPLPAAWLGEHEGAAWLLRVTAETAIGDYQIGDHLLLRAAPPAAPVAAAPPAADVSSPATSVSPANIPMGEIVAARRDVENSEIVLRPFARGDESAGSLVLGRVIGWFRPPL